MTINSRLRISRTYFFIVIFAVLLIGFVYKSGLHTLINNKSGRDSNSELLSGTDSKNASVGSLRHKKDSVVAESKTSALIASKATLSGFSPIEMNEIETWFASHGNFMFESEKNQYTSYNVDTLKQLGEAGDIRALHELTKLYLNQDNSSKYGFDAALPLYWKAATYGSTQALIELGIVTDAKYRFGLYSEEEKRQAILDVLSLYEVAAMRGDKWGVLVYGKSMTSSSAINLTELEKESVKNRSQEIFTEIQQKRYELGLGQFDNNVPNSINQFFNQWDSHP